MGGWDVLDDLVLGEFQYGGHACVMDELVDG